MIIIEQGECGYHVIDYRTIFEIEECEAFGRHGYNVVAVIPGDDGHDNGGRWSMAWYTDREQAEQVVTDCTTLKYIKDWKQTYQLPIDMPGAYTGKLEMYPEDGYNPYYDRYHPRTTGRCEGCQMKKYGIGLKEE